MSKFDFLIKLIFIGYFESLISDLISKLQFKMADPRWRIKKVKIGFFLLNSFLKGFSGASYEFSIEIAKFIMANLRLRT